MIDFTHTSGRGRGTRSVTFGAVTSVIGKSTFEMESSEPVDLSYTDSFASTPDYVYTSGDALGPKVLADVFGSTTDPVSVSTVSPAGRTCDAIPDQAWVLAWVHTLVPADPSVSGIDTDYPLFGGPDAEQIATLQAIALLYIPDATWEATVSDTTPHWAGELDDGQTAAMITAASILASQVSQDIVADLFLPLGVFTRRLRKTLPASATGGDGDIVLDVPLMDPITTAIRRALLRYVPVDDNQQQAAQSELIAVSSDTVLAMTVLQARVDTWVLGRQTTTGARVLREADDATPPSFASATDDTGEPYVPVGEAIPYYGRLDTLDDGSTVSRLDTRLYNPIIGIMTSDSPFSTGLWGRDGVLSGARGLLMPERDVPMVAALPLNWETNNQLEFIDDLVQWILDLDAYLKTWSVEGIGLSDLLASWEVEGTDQLTSLLDQVSSLGGHVLAVNEDAQSQLTDMVSKIDDSIDQLLNRLRRFRVRARAPSGGKTMLYGALAEVLLTPLGAVIAGNLLSDAADQLDSLIQGLEQFRDEANEAAQVGTEINDVLSHLMFGFRSALGGFGSGKLGWFVNLGSSATSVEEQFLTNQSEDAYRRLTVGLSGPWYPAWLRGAEEYIDAGYEYLVSELSDLIASLESGRVARVGPSSGVLTAAYVDHLRTLLVTAETFTGGPGSFDDEYARSAVEEKLREVLGHPYIEDATLRNTAVEVLDGLAVEAESATPVYMLDGYFFDWGYNDDFAPYEWRLASMIPTRSRELPRNESDALDTSTSSETIDTDLHAGWVVMASPLYQLVRAIDLASGMLEAGLQAESTFLALSGLPCQNDSAGLLFREAYGAYGMALLNEVLPGCSIPRFVAACWRQAMIDRLFKAIEGEGYDMDCMYELVPWMSSEGDRSRIEDLLGPWDDDLGHRRYDDGLLGVMGGAALVETTWLWSYQDTLDDGWSLLHHDQQDAFQSALGVLIDRTKLDGLQSTIDATGATATAALAIIGADIGITGVRSEFASGIADAPSPDFWTAPDWLSSVDAAGRDTGMVTIGAAESFVGKTVVGSVTGWRGAVLSDGEVGLGRLGAFLETGLGPTAMGRLRTLVGGRLS